MSGLKIVVVGSSNTDLVVEAPRIPVPGETVLGGDFSVLAGGKGANQAVAAARLGAEVTFVACIGKDDFGDRAVRGFGSEGIDTRYIGRIEGVPSGVALIVVAENGENAIVVAPGSNGLLSPADIEGAADTICAADVVVAQLEVPVETVERAFALARAAGATTLLNPAPATELPSDLFALVDWITPNETEAALLSGSTDGEEIDIRHTADVLLQRGVNHVVITRGSRGALYTSRDQTLEVPAREVDAVDTVAAGDAFNGALAVALGRGQDTESALRFASAAASISVTRRGAQPSMPTADDVARALAR